MRDLKKQTKTFSMIWLCFYKFWVNFTHFQSNFETLNGDKVVSAGIHGRKWQWVRNSKKDAIFMIWLCFYQLWVNFNHFWSNFKLLNGDKVVSAAIHSRKFQWVRNSKQDDIFAIWFCFYNFGSIFCQILKCAVVTKWHQPEFMVGHAQESGTATRCHIYYLIMLLSIWFNCTHFVVKF